MTHSDHLSRYLEQFKAQQAQRYLRRMCMSLDDETAQPPLVDITEDVIPRVAALAQAIEAALVAAEQLPPSLRLARVTQLWERARGGEQLLADLASFAGARATALAQEEST